jgi:NAD(P)-dependent dehydrogenase (short-subunit alcohol dehydrogenase family)
VVNISATIAEVADSGTPAVLTAPRQVSDVVDAILFLESSSYITGEILHIDGGQSSGH